MYITGKQTTESTWLDWHTAVPASLSLVMKVCISLAEILEHICISLKLAEWNLEMCKDSKMQKL